MPWHVWQAHVPYQTFKICQTEQYTDLHHSVTLIYVCLQSGSGWKKSNTESLNIFTGLAVGKKRAQSIKLRWGRHLESWLGSDYSLSVSFLVSVENSVLCHALNLAQVQNKSKGTVSKWLGAVGTLFLCGNTSICVRQWLLMKGCTNCFGHETNLRQLVVHDLNVVALSEFVSIFYTDKTCSMCLTVFSFYKRSALFLFIFWSVHQHLCRAYVCHFSRQESGESISYKSESVS